MSNPWRNYLQNFRNNLPSGVTYRSDIARYIFNNRRFVSPWDVVRYRQYLIKLGFKDDLSQVLATLFSNDEPGFLLTASPETCFTDTAGTTQAEPGDPVALWLDQSGNDNHATQPTVANRPILGRKPKGGRRNLANTTDLFAGSLTNLVTTSETTPGRPGSPHLQKIIPDTSDAEHLNSVSASILGGSGLTYRISCDFKAGGYEQGRIILRRSSANQIIFSIDLTTGAVSQSVRGANTPTILSTSSTEVAPGVWNLRVVVTAAPSNNFSLSVSVAPLSAGSSRDFMGDGSSGAFAGRLQMETSSDFTEFQEVAANGFDVTEVGVPDRHYLFFGGASDPRWMETPVITPGTDAAQVFAGVRVLEGGENQQILGLSDAATDDGTLNLHARMGVDGMAAFRHTGDTDTRIASFGSMPDIPRSNVLTGIGDLGGDITQLRVDGALEAEDTDSLGARDYTDAKVFIGSTSSGLFLNGEISALTTRFGPNLTIEEIEKVEAFTASKVAEETLP